MAEEDGVEHVHLHVLVFIGVDWLDITLDDCHSPFGCRFTEIIVNLVNSPVSLGPLNNIIFLEISDNLVFFIPVSGSLWINAIERVQEVSELFL